MIGKIRSIRDDKDYAFLVSGVNRDIFLHKSQFRGNWEELRALWAKGSVEVEFNVEEGPKGLKALKCKLLEKNGVL